TVVISLGGNVISILADQPMTNNQLLGGSPLVGYVSSLIDEKNNELRIFADNQSVVTNENSPLGITLSGSDANPNTDLTASIVTQPAHGRLGQINQQTGFVTYTPGYGYIGDDSFSFKVNNGRTASRNVGTVFINIKNVSSPSSNLQPSFQNNNNTSILPTATDQSVRDNLSTSIDITLSAPDHNPNTDLSATIVSNPTHGTLS